MEASATAPGKALPQVNGTSFGDLIGGLMSSVRSIKADPRSSGARFFENAPARRPGNVPELPEHAAEAAVEAVAKVPGPAPKAEIPEGRPVARNHPEEPGIPADEQESAEAGASSDGGIPTGTAQAETEEVPVVPETDGEIPSVPDEDDLEAAAEAAVAELAPVLTGGGTEAVVVPVADDGEILPTDAALPEIPEDAENAGSEPLPESGTAETLPGTAFNAVLEAAENTVVPEEAVVTEAPELPAEPVPGLSETPVDASYAPAEPEALPAPVAPTAVEDPAAEPVLQDPYDLETAVPTELPVDVRDVVEEVPDEDAPATDIPAEMIGTTVAVPATPETVVEEDPAPSPVADSRETVEVSATAAPVQTPESGVEVPEAESPAVDAPEAGPVASETKPEEKPEEVPAEDAEVPASPGLPDVGFDWTVEESVVADPSEPATLETPVPPAPAQPVDDPADDAVGTGTDGEDAGGVREASERDVLTKSNEHKAAHGKDPKDDGGWDQPGSSDDHRNLPVRPAAAVPATPAVPGVSPAVPATPASGNGHADVPTVEGPSSGPVAAGLAGPATDTPAPTATGEAALRPDPAAYIERVVRAARLTQGREQTRIRIMMTPPRLGSLRVDLSVRDRVLTGNLRVESAEAKQLVQSHMDDLREALLKQGLQVGEFQVTVDQGYQKPQAGNDGSNRHGRSRSSGSREDGIGSGGIPELAERRRASLRNQLLDVLA